MFGQVFTEFARNRASDGAAKNAQARIRMHAAAFNRAEKEYGVPPAVIAAFWGLESSFGAELGKLHTLPSLVSLAYDCQPLRDVPEGDHRRVEDHRSRRSHSKRDDRVVGWRTRPGRSSCLRTTSTMPSTMTATAIAISWSGVPDVIGSTARITLQMD